MATSSVHPDGHTVERQDAVRLPAGAALRDAPARGEAANETPRPRAVLHTATQAPVRPHGPNLSISAWYAISGTAMA